MPFKPRQRETISHKRIGYAIPTLNRAGTEVKCLTLCEGISKARGWGSVVFYCDYGKGEVEEWASTLSDNDPVRISPNPKHIPRTVRSFSDSSLDALFINFFGSHALRIAIMARLAGIRDVICITGSVLGSDSMSSTQKANLKLHLMVARLAGVRYVAASNAIKSSYGTQRIRLSPVSVIHNGSDIDKIHGIAEETRQRTARSEAFRYIMVARVDASKDFETLIDAFDKLQKMVPAGAVELHIVGDGNHRQFLQEKCRQLGIADRVIFAGYRADIPEALAEADCFVFSAKPIEGFGMVLIEALAAELPIIASDVAACREVLEDGALGKLFAAGNSDDLARKMLDALEAGRNRNADVPKVPEVRELYGVERMARDYIALIE